MDSDDEVQWVPNDHVVAGGSRPRLREVILNSQLYDPNGQPWPVGTVIGLYTMIGPGGVPVPITENVQLNHNPIQQAEVEDFYAIDQSQLVNPVDAEDYCCRICYQICNDPTIHGTSPKPGCPGLFCLKCIKRYIRDAKDYRPVCPYRCNGSELMSAPGALVPLPLKAPSGKKSLRKMNNLLLKCKFESCRMIVRYGDYKDHIDICEKYSKSSY